MWMLLSAAHAWTYVSVGSFGTAATFQDLLVSHGSTKELYITVLEDVPIPGAGVRFQNQTAVYITSTTNKDDPRAITLTGNMPAIEVTNGTLAVDDLIVRRTGGAGVAFQGQGVTLSHLRFDQVGWGGTGMVVSFDTLAVSAVDVCGGAGATSSPLFLANEAVTISDLRIEGASSPTGWALEADNGGSVTNATVWMPSGNGLRGPDLSLDSVVVYSDGIALEGEVTRPIATDDVVAKGTQTNVAGAVTNFTDANQVFYSGDNDSHCGYDARPAFLGLLWSPTGDHIGGYHGDVPEPGWDDDDGDGFGYGVECDDKNADVFPGAVELCDDQVDQDCVGGDNAGNVDDPGALAGWPDGDGDTFGDYASEPLWFCSSLDLISAGYVDNDLDCDDEVGGKQTTTLYADVDLDGYPNEDAPEEGCDEEEGLLFPRKDGLWDCVDSNGSVNPSEDEVCEQELVDNDCDGDLPPDDSDCDEDTVPGDDDDDDGTGDDDDDDDVGGTGLDGTGVDDTSVGVAAAGCACQQGGATGLGWGVGLVAWLLRRRRHGGGAGPTMFGR